MTRIPFAKLLCPLMPLNNSLHRTILLLGIAVSFAVGLASPVVAQQQTERLAEGDYGSGVMTTSILGENTEKQLPHDASFTQWQQDEKLFEQEKQTKIEIQQVSKRNITTKKLKDVVPPITFESGEVNIPEEYISKFREILLDMQDRVNVRLHFIGHTDNVQLTGEAQAKYGNNLLLSQERAGTTAEFFQRALHLPPEAISYEGVGDSKPIAENNTEAGRAKNRRVEVQVWYDEVSEEVAEREVEVAQETKRIKICRVETVCQLRYKQGHSRRAKLKNLVPPLHYDHGVADLPEPFLDQLKQALHNLKDKQNVQMRFIGFTDNAPLNGRDARIYGDHTGLSKANARRVALAVQEAMDLPNSAVSSTGKGTHNPLASNNSEKGRSLNRRIEVEFWHDDSLEDLPEAPQICPEASAAETVERIYNPPDGDIKPIVFENGKPLIPAGYTQRLQRGMQDIKDKGNVRLRFIGYTSNERLDRRTAMVYGDDIGLSTARARRAMQAVKQELGLKENQTEFEGRGYVQSRDVVNAGFIELDQSKVEVQIVYDELAMLDDSEGLEIKRMSRDVEPKNPYALNLMRISVDGQPINDPNKNIPDVQRCTDVALDKAQIQFKFDNLQIKPRLNVTAWPNVISAVDNDDTEVVESQSHFKMYTNYPSYIDRAEVRLFNPQQSNRDKPWEVVPLDPDGYAEWHFLLDTYDYNYSAPRRELKYVLRVYDQDGNFDETSAQSLWIVDDLKLDLSGRDAQKELLVGYGENRLAVSNITLNGGAVNVYGSNVPKGRKVWFAGHSVPLSDDGEFGSEMILPNGLHTVEVAITDDHGNGNVYLRELELEKNDWFYVGIADVTVSRDFTNGPAELVTGDVTHYDSDISGDGRMAFYTKGKLANDWNLTASADTREGPVDNLFSNFMNKSPEYLFRRLDPDYHYPTYGDDSTVEEDAPTSGKFYLKAQKNRDYGMWGNFDIAYTDSNLAQVDRGLYGANVNVEANDATRFGEKRYAVNAFAAEPGTVAGRDEFLGTGGSLYYLRHQDILIGSERIRIEMRDAVSRVVIGVKSLVYGIDYDIDYLQGRILLSEPLSASSATDMIVDTGASGDNQVYLIVRYEYTPGFDDIDDVAMGGRGHYWFGDYVKFGITAEKQEAAGYDATLNGLDMTLRKNAATWLKLEHSTSQGPVSATDLSNDGGFNFNEIAIAPDSKIKAHGQRIDASVGFEEIVDTARGRLTVYHQQLDAGYSAPGLITRNDSKQSGGTVQVPVTQSVSVRAKADSKIEKNALDTRAAELNVDYQMNSHLGFSAGVRNDKRIDNSPVVPLTQRQGERTDVALRATYDTRKRLKTYAYVQDTVNATGNLDENDRIGVGSDYRTTDRLRLGGELSTGDQGPAVKLATDYKMTARTNLYNSYTFENARTDNGVRARKGNMAAGFKTRYSDSASMYMEERYTHGDVPTGLTHTMGFDLAATDRLNFGGNFDIGTLKNHVTAAKIKRKAVGLRVGYRFDAFSYAGALEYRVDDSQLADASYSKRTTWLTKNSIKYKLNPDWRLLGKLNYSVSNSSLGEYYDGSFTEAVLGYAFRPVAHNALNALFKYTYFYNLPSTGQVTLANTAAEYIQKSHILSLDVMYDLSKTWTVGGKYAYRLGQLSQDRVNPQFFSSAASLYVLRADWHFLHKWDALIEARMLDLPDAGDRRAGMLLGIYRHFNQNIKGGIGYNFTDFSDDLTDLDYDSQGFFINVIGKF